MKKIKSNKYKWTRKDKVSYSCVCIVLSLPFVFLLSYDKINDFFHLFCLHHDYYMLFPSSVSLFVFLCVIVVILLRLMFYFGGTDCRRPFKEWLISTKKEYKRYIKNFLVYMLCLILSLLFCLNHIYYIDNEGYHYKQNTIFSFDEIEKIEISASSFTIRSLSGSIVGEKVWIIQCQVYANEQEFLFDSESFVSLEKMYDFLSKIDKTNIMVDKSNFTSLLNRAEGKEETKYIIKIRDING